MPFLLHQRILVAATSSKTIVMDPQILGPEVDALQQKALQSLPAKPSAVVIDYSLPVVLQPYEEAAHSEQLWSLLNGEPVLGHPTYNAEDLVWLFLWGKPASLEAFRQGMRRRNDAADARSWVMRLRPSPDHDLTSSNSVDSWPMVGTVSLICASVEHLRVEIGFIVVTPAYQGSPVTCTATYLLLRHCFEAGYRRVEWKTHVANRRSRAAAERMGFVHEGVFRCHCIVQGNRSRDTAWYSLISEEWAGVRKKLELFLHSHKAAEAYKARAAGLVLS